MNNKVTTAVIVFLSATPLFSSCTSGKTKQSIPASSSTAVSAQPNAPPTAEKQVYTVYITKTGKKYHAEGCRYLSQSYIPVHLRELDTKKYSPCSVYEPWRKNGR